MTYKIHYYILIIIASIFALSSCNTDKISPSKTITKLAITKAHGSSGYEQYKIWIKHHDSTIMIYDLYELSLDSANKIMNIVDGVIISGGPDVNPSLYNEDSLAYICEIPDNYRDSLEFQTIEYAYRHLLPILGICRGQQILNVYFDGSLIADIPTKHSKTVIHRCKAKECLHKIIMDTDNNNLGYSKGDTILVNSYHHQAINRIAESFDILAMAEDSIIESVCLKDEINYPNFFLAVQFHPEHLIDTKVSNTIATNFIEALKNQSQLRK